MPKKRTPAQIEASRLNGAKSKGPTTKEGRDRASLNAMKHGMCTSRHVVLPTEKWELFEDLRNAYLADFKPATQAEYDCIDEMACAHWRLRRIRLFEIQALSDQSE